MLTNAFECFFPVIVGEQETPPRGPVVIRQICGTAFPISNNHFLTAAHVIKEVTEHAWFGIAYPQGKQFKVTPILDYETSKSGGQIFG